MAEFVFDLNANMEIVGSEEHNAFINPEIIDILSSEEEMNEFLDNVYPLNSPVASSLGSPAQSPSLAFTESPLPVVEYFKRNRFACTLPTGLEFFNGIGATSQLTDT
jgi:hypothetical protein